MSEFYTSQLDKEECFLHTFDDEFKRLVHYDRVRHLPVEQNDMEVVSRGFVRADRRIRAAGRASSEEVDLIERYADIALAWLQTEIDDADKRGKTTCNRTTEKIKKALQVSIDRSESEEERLNIRAKYMLFNPLYGAWRAIELLKCAKGEQPFSKNKPESLLKVPSVIF